MAPVATKEKAEYELREGEVNNIWFREATG